MGIAAIQLDSQNISPSEKKKIHQKFAISLNTYIEVTVRSAFVMLK